MFYVYLPQSQKDKTYYIGQTDNTDARLKRHNSAQVISTKSRIPWLMIGFEKYKTRNEARWREYSLKKNSAQKKEFIKTLISSRGLMDKAQPSEG
jgi:putative endonuclease